jgi:hypothetical protein
MMLIGLNGKAGSGKDTAFTFINEWATFHGYKAERDAFADRLKISAGRALGIHSEDGSEELAFCNAIKVNSKISLKWDDGKAHHHELTGREYLQYYGTEAHRQVFSDDFWINMVLGPERPGVDILVITDVHRQHAVRLRDAVSSGLSRSRLRARRQGEVLQGCVPLVGAVEESCRP